MSNKLQKVYFFFVGDNVNFTSISTGRDFKTETIPFKEAVHFLI